MTALPEGFLAHPFAHRALHGPGLPENGLSAVRAAVAGGYAIEIDVQPSSDGRAMVFHDQTLDRMTDEDGPVAARTAAELGGIALQGTGDTIPTLAEVLRTIGGRVPLVIEIKDQSGRFGPTDGVLETAVAADLAGFSGPVAVMSYNPHTVLRMRDLTPGIARGLTTETFTPNEAPGLTAEERRSLSDMTMLEDAGAVFISHDVNDLASPAVAAVRARGLPVLCWTVRSPAAARQALKTADQITFEGFLPA